MVAWRNPLNPIGSHAACNTGFFSIPKQNKQNKQNIHNIQNIQKQGREKLSAHAHHGEQRQSTATHPNRLATWSGCPIELPPKYLIRLTVLGYHVLTSCSPQIDISSSLMPTLLFNFNSNSNSNSILACYCRCTLAITPLLSVVTSTRGSALQSASSHFFISSDSFLDIWGYTLLILSCKPAMSKGGALLKSGSALIRILEFLCAALVLGIFSYFLACGCSSCSSRRSHRWRDDRSHPSSHAYSNMDEGCWRHVWRRCHLHRLCCDLGVLSWWNNRLCHARSSAWLALLWCLHCHCGVDSWRCQNLQRCPISAFEQQAPRLPVSKSSICHRDCRGVSVIGESGSWLGEC